MRRADTDDPFADSLDDLNFNINISEPLSKPEEEESKQVSSNGFVQEAWSTQ